MDLFSLAMMIIVIGVLMWLVNTYIPMDDKFKQILNIVIVVALVLFLLNLFVPSHYWNIRVGGR